MTEIAECYEVARKLEARVWKLEKEAEGNADAIRIGNAEIKRRKKASAKTLGKRRATRRDKLVKTWSACTTAGTALENAELLKAVRRYLGITQHCKLKLRTRKPGEPAKPRYEGEPAYYTTPSGKTIVEYPKAYKYPTVYHPCTESCTIGVAWLSKNLRRIAAEEVEKQIR